MRQTESRGGGALRKDLAPLQHLHDVSVVYLSPIAKIEALHQNPELGADIGYQ
jgi:hypothetical protein